jgi:hypothetical protein
VTTGRAGRAGTRLPDRPAGPPEVLVVDPADPVPFHAQDSYRAGVRSIVLPRPVDLAEPVRADVAALDIVRRATAQAFRVSWVLRAVPPSLPTELLSHLHPPSRFDRPPHPDELEQWRDGFYLGRCCWRQGPGFIEIRDRRHGSLARYTITEPDLAQAVYALDRGDQPVAAAAGPLLAEQLVLRFGEHSWLAPYRLVRWPSPAMSI